MKVSVISDLEDFLLHGLRNVESSFADMVKGSQINEIVMLPKTKPLE